MDHADIGAWTGAKADIAVLSVYSRAGMGICRYHCTAFPEVACFSSDIATMPIVYKSDLEIASYQLPAKNLINWTTLASVKSADWEFQNEIRIVADFQHADLAIKDKVEVIEIPNFDYLLIPIEFSKLEKIVITFSPWMQEQTKQMVSESIKQLDLDCICDTENSQFDKLIRRK